MLEILLMDNELNNKIAELILHAEVNPFDFDTMKHASDNKLPIIPEGCNDFEIELPLGIRVVYTVEEHPRGVCKHISVSQNNDTPSHDNLFVVLRHFGFITTLRDNKSYAYIESCVLNGEKCKAFNVIETLF
jgi:hypothetical protein